MNAVDSQTPKMRYVASVPKFEVMQWGEKKRKVLLYLILKQKPRLGTLNCEL